MTQRRGTIAGLSTCLYALALAGLSLAPSGRTGALGSWDRSVSPTVQNALHVPAYAVLTIAASWSLLGALRIRRSAILAALACCAYGALLESLQALVPGRTGSLLDVLLNAVGVGAGLAVIAAWRLVRSRRASPASTGGLTAPAEPQETR